ncbi:MAG: HesA/MoeB/ThiF family protein [Desulfobacteraceae bacterium]
MSRELKTAIEAECSPQKMPDGTKARVVTARQIEALALRFDTNGKAIEIAALEIGVYPERYIRNFKTYRPEDQIRLLKSKVTVVGLGGLGGTVIEWLTRAGVGQLNLVDGDRFEDHNLNRQLLSTQNSIGTTKARAGAERVRAINSSLTVEAHAEYLDAQNGSRLIRDSDVVVDCLDNIESRFVLEAAAKKANIPMVSAAVAGLSGQVTTIFPKDRGLESIYGPMDALTSPKGAETVLGCLPQAVGLIAAAESAEVIKVLLGQDKQLLRNQMLWVDISANTYETLKLE